MILASFFLNHLHEFIGLAALLVFSGFFSGSETALFNLTRGELHRLRNAGGSGAMAARLMDQPRRTLNVLLLANMIVNVAFSAISVVMLLGLEDAQVPGWAITAALFVPPLSLILFGEVCPKALAFPHKIFWVRCAGPPLLAGFRVLGPLVWLFETFVVDPLTRLIVPARTHRPEITDEELDAVLDLSAKRGLIDHDTNSMLQSIFELREIRVSQIMVPRVDMVAWDINAPRAGLEELFRRTRLRRLPVYDREIDNLLGIVHAKRVLLGRSVPLRELIVPATFVPETADIERVLLHLRNRRTQMAIVVDEYGGTAGLVTLEDAARQIVGEMPDPSGRSPGPAVEHVGPHEYLVDADLSVREWSDSFQMDLDSRGIRSVGGLVLSLLGRMPVAGDSVRYRNLVLTVESLRGRTGRRVGKVRVRLEGGRE
jgi:putative hemolysin